MSTPRFWQATVTPPGTPTTRSFRCSLVRQGEHEKWGVAVVVHPRVSGLSILEVEDTDPAGVLDGLSFAYIRHIRRVVMVHLLDHGSFFSWHRDSSGFLHKQIPVLVRTLQWQEEVRWRVTWYVGTVTV